MLYTVDTKYPKNLDSHGTNNVIPQERQAVWHIIPAETGQNVC